MSLATRQRTCAYCGSDIHDWQRINIEPLVDSAIRYIVTHWQCSTFPPTLKRTVMDTVTMYDSVTASDIPPNAVMVGGYLNGTYKWSTADWARFPNAFHVGISTRADVDGDVLDVEPGDATPAQAPTWALRQRARDGDPVIYCDRSRWPLVRNAFRAAHVAEPHYWLAQPDGVAELVPGTIAKQYIGAPASGGHYDKSIVSVAWPGLEKHMSAFDDEFAFAMERMRELAATGQTPKWAVGKRFGDYGLIDFIGVAHDAMTLIEKLRDELAELRAIMENQTGVKGGGTISGTFTVGS